MNYIFSRKKQSLRILLSVACLLAAGCGTAKPADLTDAENYVSENRDILRRVFSDFESMDSAVEIRRSPYGDHKGEYCVWEEDAGSETVISDDDGLPADIVRFLSEQNGSICRKEYGIEIWVLYGDEGLYILKSDLSPEEMICPIDLDYAAADKLNWKKTVDGEEVHFIADHRKDKDTYWKNMYYRIDMKHIDKGLFIYRLTEKYPWYSRFM